MSAQEGEAAEVSAGGQRGKLVRIMIGAQRREVKPMAERDERSSNGNNQEKPSVATDT